MIDLSLRSSKTQIFGKNYQLKKFNSVDLPYGVCIRGEELIINRFNSKVNSKTLFERFLKNTAGKYIIPRTHFWGEKMDLSFNRIALKQQKTRWGSCSSNKNLNFNWRLVHFEPKIIDHVIIHELSHLVHMNHSRDFWKLVEKHDPEYKKNRGFLKRVRVVYY
jgi:predicted metal-dependent hydrolase